VASTDQVTFLLDRFEWTAPGRLRVAGAWSGVPRRDLEEPALIVHSGREVHRLQVIDGVLNRTRHWLATFPWEGDPAAIEGATLEVSGSFVVDLPVPQRGSGQRRFGRTRLAVREIGPEDGESAEPGAGGGTESIDAYAAAIEAREEAAEAKEELKLAQAAITRAREDADRERSRRTSEGARLHEALETLRRLAEESLERERVEAQRLARELDDAEGVLADERARTAQLQQELAAAVEARDDAGATGRAQSAEVERLQGLLDEARADARRAVDEAERMRGQLAEVRAALEDDD
jgi:hypothetical protein